jgi:hypothetical protein
VLRLALPEEGMCSSHTGRSRSVGTVGVELVVAEAREVTCDRLHDPLGLTLLQQRLELLDELKAVVGGQPSYSTSLAMFGVNDPAP